MIDPSVQDLIASLRAEGQLTAQGEFGLDAQQARAKLQQFQLEDPHHYILEWVQAAHLLGATRISIRQDANELWFWCDGQALTVSELEELYAAAFRRRANLRDLAMRRLALGMSAAQALQPALVELVSQAPNTQAVRLVQRAGKPDQVGPVNHKRPGLSLYVAERARLRHALEFIRSLGGELEESAVVRARCAPSRCEISLNGKRISRGFALPHAVEARVALDHPMARGLIGLSRQTQHTPSHLALIQHGVVITRHELPAAPWAVCGELEVPTLSTDLSQRRFIEDDAWRALWLEAIEPALYEAALSLVRQDGQSAWSVAVARHVVDEVCRYRRDALPLSQALIQLACALEFAPLWLAADAPHTLLSARDLGVSLQNDAHLCVTRERLSPFSSLNPPSRPALLPNAAALVTYLARPVENITRQVILAERRAANLARLEQAVRWHPMRGEPVSATSPQSLQVQIELACRLDSRSVGAAAALKRDARVLFSQDRRARFALLIYYPASDRSLRLLLAQERLPGCEDLHMSLAGQLPLTPDASGVELEALDDAFWEALIDTLHALMIARLRSPDAREARVALASRWLLALLAQREVVWAMQLLGVAPARLETRAAALIAARTSARLLATRAADRASLLRWLGPLARAPLLTSLTGPVSLELLCDDDPACSIWQVKTEAERAQALALIDRLRALGLSPARPVVMLPEAVATTLTRCGVSLVRAGAALREQLNRAIFLAKPQAPLALQLAPQEALTQVSELGLRLALLAPTSSSSLVSGNIIASVRYQGRELDLLDAPLPLGECVAVLEDDQLIPSQDWTGLLPSQAALDAARARLIAAAWRAWGAFARSFDAPSACAMTRLLVLRALALGSPTLPATLLEALEGCHCIAARIGAQTRWLTRVEAAALHVRGALSETLIAHRTPSDEAVFLLPDHPDALDALRGALARPELRSLDSIAQRAATMSAKRQAFLDAPVLAIEPPAQTLYAHPLTARALAGVLAILPDPHPTRSGGTLTVELLREGRLVSTQTLGCVMGHLWARCEAPRVFHMGSLALRQEPLAETHQALLEQVRPALIGWCQSLKHPLDDNTRQLILRYLHKLRVVRREDDALRRALGAVALFDTPQDNSPLSFDGLISRAPGLHDMILCAPQARDLPDTHQEPRPIIVIDDTTRALLQPLLAARQLVSLEAAPAIAQASPSHEDALWHGQLANTPYASSLAVLPERERSARANLATYLHVGGVLVAVTNLDAPAGSLVAHLTLEPPPDWTPGAALDLNTLCRANDAARALWAEAMLAAIAHHHDAPTPLARLSMQRWLGALAARSRIQDAERVYHVLCDVPLFEVASSPADHPPLSYVSASQLLTWPWPEEGVLMVSPHTPAPPDVPALRLDEDSAYALRALLGPKRTLWDVAHWRDTLPREASAGSALQAWDERDRDALEALKRQERERALAFERAARDEAAQTSAQRERAEAAQTSAQRERAEAAQAAQAAQRALAARLDAVRAPLRAARLAGASRQLTLSPDADTLARLEGDHIVLATTHPAWRHLDTRGPDDPFAASFVAAAICHAAAATASRQAALSALIIEVVLRARPS